jgi:hypothetical protein
MRYVLTGMMAIMSIGIWSCKKQDPTYYTHATINGKPVNTGYSSATLADSVLTVQCADLSGTPQYPYLVLIMHPYIGPGKYTIDTVNNTGYLYATYSREVITKGSISVVSADASSISGSFNITTDARQSITGTFKAQLK